MSRRRSRSQNRVGNNPPQRPRSSSSNRMLNSVNNKLKTLVFNNSRQLGTIPVKPQPAQQQQSKRKGKKNLNANAANSNMATNISKQLTRRPKSNYLLASQLKNMAYIRCRLDPFSMTGSMGIPDGSSVRKICVDYRTFSDITLGGPATIYILSMPTLPVTTYVKASTANVTITSNSGTTNLPAYTSIGSGSILTNWTPLTEVPELSTFASTNPISATPNSYVNVPNPYSAVRCRIVTVATRIFYTGSSFSCAGSLTSSNVNFEATDGNVGLNNTLLTNVDDTGLANLIPVGTVNSVPVKYNMNPANFQQDTVTNRPETGGYILLKHDSNEYQWCKAQNSPILFFGDVKNTPNTTYTETMLSSLNGKIYPGTFMYDFNWSGNLLIISNCNSGMSFRVENVFCVEYELEQASAFERLAQKGNNYPEQIKAANSVSADVPTMQPSNANMDPWYIKAAQVAGRIGKTLVKEFL